ncbi:unnamed protein product [Rotaria sp. Silwood2]|nr:unnamed protein product [Rotaria sp. Silwood2]
MYDVDHHRLDGYCLLYSVNNTAVSPDTFIYQLISYCLRPVEQSLINLHPVVTFDSNFTFSTLREKNISSEQLLSWSASIDLAEHYQAFLNDISPSSLTFKKEDLFYSCLWPWFGPFCQFSFDPPDNISFDTMVARNFPPENIIVKDDRITCYKHLDCDTSLQCLDWREICNGKIDCVDGSDELNCWQLEINECAENEYRCHNGQCIPAEFFHDIPSNPDCLDRTDERFLALSSPGCFKDPSFRCEEHSCRPGYAEFPCGDGGCIVEKTNRCRNKRGEMISSDDLCSKTMECITNTKSFIDNAVREVCATKICPGLICPKSNCPSLYQFPSYPILFGNVWFIHENKDRQLNMFPVVQLPKYMCYDDQRFISQCFPFAIRINDSACYNFDKLGLPTVMIYNDLILEVQKLFRPCIIVSNETQYCNHSTIYQCQNSTRCISKHRLVDSIQDCPFNDDEMFNQSCSLNDAHRRFTCRIHKNKVCLAPLTILDTIWDCDDRSDEFDTTTSRHYNENFDFERLCDNRSDAIPVSIDGLDETDENECQHWPCNNTYTRCDGFWSCKDGADEVNCPPSTCLEFEHSCVFPSNASTVSCLPIARAGDGIVDCLGELDERHSPIKNSAGGLEKTQNPFFCGNKTYKVGFGHNVLCDNQKHCPFGDDEVFCEKYLSPTKLLCNREISARNKVENYFCDVIMTKNRRKPSLKLRHMPVFPLQLMTYETTSITLSSTYRTIQLGQSIPISNIRYPDSWRCNRGLAILIRLNKTMNVPRCLCPPSYYGDKCEYQNQRVSLTLQIRMTSDWRIPFTFILSLVDNERNIESKDYIEYWAIRDCDTKFDVYLLYSSRPKNPSKNFSVVIDAFNKLTLKYRASWIFPIQFPFLPVHRLAVRLIVPTSTIGPHESCTPSCIHGHCSTYVNNRSSTFCRCQSGWTGLQCNIQYTCDCASDSLCVDNSTCVCPTNRFGPRCYLLQSTCHSGFCKNDGRCVSNDIRHAHLQQRKAVCSCSEEFSGDYCERRNIRIDISFDKRLTIPQLITVHFITSQPDTKQIQMSTMKRIPFNQDEIKIYSSLAFNIAFAAIFNEYYLIALREQNIVVNISTQIIPSNRCPFVRELFNETLRNFSLLRLVKYYHIPCQERSELVCFYDKSRFCLCDLTKQANCFKFNHYENYSCRGYNLCENGGQCVEDNERCPTLSICVCPECYYGSKCQFNTYGSILSLDVILGNQIRLNTVIHNQPTVVKVVIVFTVLTLVFSLLNSFFSLSTFKMKKTRDVGCGYYLFIISITSIITVCLLTIKVAFLLATQIGSLTNRSFLYTQCVSVDFFLRVALSTGDWLSACIGIERATSISKGINFNKRKSRNCAKWIVLIVVLFTGCTHIHDPIHRRLIDDEGQRTWCLAKYSPSLQAYDRIVNAVHLTIPVVFNFISALIIIVLGAYIRSKTQKNQSLKQLLFEQIQLHKHLLISQYILLLLGLPRLIFSFLSACMKSIRNPWLYLIGYFISFIPQISTFVVFVLPSKVYMRELHESLRHFFKN